MNISKIRDVVFILSAYLTICSILYLVAYWGTFSLNGIQFISLTNILSNIIQPVFSEFIVLTFGTSVGFLLALNNDFGNEDESESSSLKAQIIFLSIWAFFVTFVYYVPYGGFLKWYIYVNAVGIPIFYKIRNYLSFMNFIEYLPLREALKVLFIVTPVSFFAIGKMNSNEVFSNVNYDYIVLKDSGIHINSLDSLYKNKIDTLKLIGATDKFFVFSSLNNEEKIFLKDDEISRFVLKQKRTRNFSILYN